MVLGTDPGTAGAQSGAPVPGPACKLLKRMEAPPGFEPGMEVLQTSALPLGDGAGRTSAGRPQ